MSTFPAYADAFLRWAFNDLKKAAEILDRHPKVLRSTNGLGETVLHYLAVEGKTEAVALLIAKGADVNTRNHLETPLHKACRGKSLEVVELLLKAGADVNAFDGLERPLDVALEAKRADLAEVLRAAGAVETVWKDD